MIALGRRPEMLNPAAKRPRLSSEATKKPPVRHFQLGTIKKIELYDFMCHGELVVKPGPDVNVITGKNGAGKSSILQALVIGLGGNAKEADRGYKSLAKFIRHGAEKAVVKLTLCNENPPDFPYGTTWKPKEYGKTIIFQRDIGQTSSLIQLKDENDKKVKMGADATSEAQKIRAHFHISLDNPTTVLQQEQAKEFFSNNDDAKLYQQIVEGTQVNRALDKYLKAAADVKLTQQKAEMVEKNLMTERDDLAREAENVKRLTTEDSRNKKRIEELRPKVLWGRQHMEKRKVESLKTQSEVFENKIAEAQKNVEMAQASVREVQSEINQIELQEGDERGRLSKKQKELRHLDEIVNEKEKNLAAARKLRDNLQTDAQLTRRQIQSIQNDLFTLKKNTHQGVEHQRAIANADSAIRSLEFDLKKSSNTLEKSLPEQFAKLDKNKYDCQQNMERLKDKHAEIEKNIGQHKKALDDFSYSTKGRYNSDIIAVCKIIEENRAEFETLPLGPLASFVTISDQYSRHFDLLEAFLGRSFLQAFLIFSKKDQDLLIKLCHKNKVKPPETYFKKSVGYRYPIVGGAKGPNVGKGLALVKDCLIVSNDEIFNLIVDKYRIERTVIGKDKVILDLFKQNPLPKDVGCVETGIGYDFYRYTPKTSTQSFSSFFIQKPSPGTKSLLEVDREVARKRQEAELANAQKRLKAIETRLKEEDQKRRDIEQEIKKVEDETEKENAKYYRLSEQLDESKEAKEQIQSAYRSVEDLENKMKELFEKLRHNSDELPAIKQEVNTAQYQVNVAKRELEPVQDEVDNLTRNLKEKIEGPKAELRIEMTKLRGKETNKARLLRHAEEALNRHMTQIRATERKRDADYQKLTQNGNFPEPEKEITTDEAKALFEEFRQLNCAQDIHKGLFTDVNYQQMQERMKSIEKMIETVKDFRAKHKNVQGAMLRRKKQWVDCFNMMAKNIRSQFAENMRRVNLESHFRLTRDEQMVTIKVRGQALDQLSGGERSKTMVCLMGALWEVQNSPFLCLDEWDVGLDDEARPDVEKVIVALGTKVKAQLFLINPTKGSPTRFEEEVEAKIKRLQVNK